MSTTPLRPHFRIFANYLFAFALRLPFEPCNYESGTGCCRVQELREKTSNSLFFEGTEGAVTISLFRPLIPQALFQY